MFSFGHADRPQFGGVGVMVAPPTVEVAIRAAEGFAACGDLADRSREFVELSARYWRLPSLPDCAIDVRSPADHTGLGVGTQLGLAIAAGLRKYLRLPALPIEELAASVGRGRRSAVGTYGFELGGLIVDAGKEGANPSSRLARRVAMPPTWRFVLVSPSEARGLAGDREVEAFAKLPPVLEHVTQELWQITNDELLPTVEAADCDAFGAAVYKIGRLAGESFAAAQGGVFASPQIAALVEAIRGFGVAGVGQSSWGPTVFAVVADDDKANRLVHWLRDNRFGRVCDVTIAQPDNAGAQLSTCR